MLDPFLLIALLLLDPFFVCPDPAAKALFASVIMMDDDGADYQIMDTVRDVSDPRAISHSYQLSCSLTFVKRLVALQQHQ